MPLLIGQQFTNNHNRTLTVIEYHNMFKVKVRFDSGYEIYTTTQAIKKGNVKDAYEPIIYGKGYLGKPRGKANKAAYSIWSAMLQRCYSSKYHLTHPTYINCEVCAEWLNFANFEKWYEKNYKPNSQLDKDALIPNNKIYSPKTCIFIENNALYKPNAKHAVKVGKRYRAAYSFKGRRIHLGYFDTPEEAKQAVLASKSQIILK